MNKYLKYTAIASAFAIALTSCIDMDELNKDPNKPLNTNPAMLLTGVSYKAFNSAAADISYATKQLVHTNEENPYQVYKFSRGSFEGFDLMRDVIKMKEEAQKAGNEDYKALSLFFEAHYLYSMTMLMGDIPCSEALKGESDKWYQPKYDSQETVLSTVLSKLAEANSLLEKTKGQAISGDIIYKGSHYNWRKLINAYRLRVLMSLSGKEKVGEHNVKSLFADIVNKGPLMSSAADNGQLSYIDQQGNRYPFFNDSSFGSGRYMDSTYVAAFRVRKDPRLFAICAQTPAASDAGKAVDDFSAYDGGDPAVPYSLVNDKVTRKGVSKPAARYYAASTNESMILLGYTEQQLILAEAVVRGWISGNAKSYYDSAVRASFDFYETYVPALSEYLNDAAAETYLQGADVAMSDNLTDKKKIELIIMQKYLPSFLQGCKWGPYFDQLRTGVPEFRRAKGIELPYRFMYPQSEYNNNAENVKAALASQFGGNDRISDKLWWLQ